MVQPGWYNLNGKRDYPLIEGVAFPTKILVDAGFMMLPQSGFIPGTHKVRLHSITNQTTTVTFTFTADTTPLTSGNVVLEFVADKTIAGYQTILAAASYDSNDATIPGIICDCDLWHGFIVVNDLDLVTAEVPLTTTVVFDFVVEPATIVSLADLHVTKIHVANKDRTRSSAPFECPPLEWPTPNQAYWAIDTCASGYFEFVQGYYLSIKQNDRTNTILFTPGKKPGYPQPCEEVLVHPDEEAPPWSPYLDGSIPCHATVRSLGGAGGPNLDMTSSGGVSISTVPAENKVIVDVNFSGLVVCPVEVEFV